MLHVFDKNMVLRFMVCVETHIFNMTICQPFLPTHVCVYFSQPNISFCWRMSSFYRV